MEGQGSILDQSTSNLRSVQYDSDKEAIYLSAIRQLISKDLSEPYSIYVYRYFLYEWGDLCFMVSLKVSYLCQEPDWKPRLWMNKII